MTYSPERVEIYDTTLRDGSQLEGISLTVEDKLRIAEQLDYLGVHYIEAGWPGANPKDDELFRRAPAELQLTTSTLVAFGSTRRVKGKVDSDDTLRHLVEANVGTVCIVGKSWDYHVHRSARHDARRGRRDGRATRSSSCAARAWTCSSTPSTSSTATSAIRSSRCACSKARRPSGASPARAVRHERRRAAARGRAHRRRGRRLLR